MNVACILAGGAGRRMAGASIPKQFLTLYDKPVLMWSVETFDRCAQIDLICLVVPPGYRAVVEGWLRQAGLRTSVRFASPGAERFDSAYAALIAVSDVCGPDDIILFHDAARPLVSLDTIEENIRLAKRYGAVYTVLPAQDTVVVSTDGRTVSDIPPRREQFQGQTPQSFRYEVIANAHAHFRTRGMEVPVTDDCSLVFRLGHTAALCIGSKQNLKITTDEDLVFLEALIAAQANRRQ
ncbi:MAG: 2-C-methyl-D-erythritol 4-phosphate cytidylyltransferase [Clostridia bacterium]|nr:2-C-methyl-D-erythritol 4-phosphate cytidylyltransferase [Clostridia bacterium]